MHLTFFLFVISIVFSAAEKPNSHALSVEKTVAIEKSISPLKDLPSHKVIETSYEKAFNEIAFRDHLRARFLKIIPLTLGVLNYSIQESKPFSKQMSYGVLFSESFLNLFNDPSTHPLIAQGPPTL